MSKVFTNVPQFKVLVTILGSPKIGLNLVHMNLYKHSIEHPVIFHFPWQITHLNLILLTPISIKFSFVNGYT